jgi:hypothetical protein
MESSAFAASFSRRCSKRIRRRDTLRLAFVVDRHHAFASRDVLSAPPGAQIESCAATE